jgi:UPF0271 protein
MRPPVPSIDLHADLGEGFPDDARLLDLVTSASISCGAHAGDRSTIYATLAAARDRGVALGAHPGYPDREGFGRIERSASADEVQRLIVGQIEFLGGLASELGLTLRYVKPHGALYNQAQRVEEIARGVVSALRPLGLPVLGQPGGVLERIATEAGLRFVAEGFPERRYGPDGRLVPRSEPGAVLHDPAEIEAQVVRLVGSGVATLCIHGDDPDAVTKAGSVRGVLTKHGIAPRFWG